MHLSGLAGDTTYEYEVELRRVGERKPGSMQSMNYVDIYIGSLSPSIPLLLTLFHSLSLTHSHLTHAALLTASLSLRARNLAKYTLCITNNQLSKLEESFLQVIPLACANEKDSSFSIFLLYCFLWSVSTAIRLWWPSWHSELNHKNPVNHFTPIEIVPNSWLY